MTTFRVHQTESFLGCNPEYADMDNPQGRMFGVAWAVEGFTEYGNSYFYKGEVVDEAHAQRLAQIFERQAARGDLDIETSYDEWMWDRHMYGSKAYQDNYHDAEMARMTDDEIEARYSSGWM
jgi:hypothetical protein